MNVRDINFILSDVSEFSELIPLFTGLFYRVRQKPYTIIVYFFMISVPVKMVSLITAKFLIYNMPLFHFLAVCEVVFLFSFFNKVLFNKIKVGGIVILILINILNSVFVESIYEFNTTAWSVNTLILLCFGLAVFHRIFNSTEINYLEKDATFVITSGWMIYFAGALFTYVLSPKIFSHEARGFFHNAWIIQSLSNIVKNFIVSYGLWMVRYR